MSEIILCGYCEELPENARAVAAHVNRCPLCKAELGVTSGGERFRIGADKAPRSWRNPIAVATAGAMCMAVIVWLATRGDEPVEMVELPPEPVPIGSVPTVHETPPPTVPAGTATFKRYAEGVLSPEARIKPQDGQLVAVPSTAEVAIGAEVGKATVQVPGLGKELHKQQAIVRSAEAQPTANLAPATIAAADYASLEGTWDLRVTREVGIEQPIIKRTSTLSNASPGEMRAQDQEVKKWQAGFKERIDVLNAKEPDGFIRSLKAENAELGGMPFLLGKACQLTVDDARRLATGALVVRSALAEGQRAKWTSASAKSHPLWTALAKNGYNAAMKTYAPKKGEDKPLLPGLTQILAAESRELRLGLVENCRGTSNAEATAALARMAIFDPDPAVRKEAVDALRPRPAKESHAVLLAGLRYPWAPIAQQAAQVVTDLKRVDLLRPLIDLLDGPDPCDPFEQAEGQTQATVVRELVRVNHHRNCLLCHAPAQLGERGRVDRSQPVGLVPSPASPLPPSASTLYYLSRPGDIVVRADVTYLRQDFSLIMRVENSAPWPEMQRFDFLVRTRRLTAAEYDAWQQVKRERSPQHISPHRAAALSALQGLTGLAPGTTGTAWRAALVDSPFYRDNSEP
jgi:hypothetical protein